MANYSLSYRPALLCAYSLFQSYAKPLQLFAFLRYSLPLHVGTMLTMPMLFNTLP